MATSTPDSVPWWAHGGSERCPVCLQLYAYEVEVRCADCDGPLCPLCAVEVTVELVARRCPDCCTGAAEEA